MQSGIQNVVFSTLGRIFQTRYGYSVGISGLVFLGVTVGFVLAAFIFGKTSDWLSRHLALRRHEEVQPEFRLPTMIFAIPCLSAGLFWYGWTAEHRVLWIAPVSGLAFVGFGLTTIQVR